MSMIFDGCTSLSMVRATTADDAAAVLTGRKRDVAVVIAAANEPPDRHGYRHLRARTVETLADHIRGKLALRSRTEIAVWAVTRARGPADPPLPSEIIDMRSVLRRIRTQG